jgi:hypothetical protein
MRKDEDKVIYGTVVHAIDLAIRDIGIRLTNSEWCCLIDIFNVLISLEV